jgi:hypothetical protein
MRTYTKHRLTDAQLRRLSALANDTKGAATAGPAGLALMRKGLAHGDRWPTGATEEGCDALVQARREGW